MAALNGLLWASVVALGAVYFFDDPQLGWVIAVAMIATILIAAIAGSLLPTLLRRMNIDPAIAGGVVLTTITDVAGFLSFWASPVGYIYSPVSFRPYSILVQCLLAGNGHGF